MEWAATLFANQRQESFRTKIIIPWFEEGKDSLTTRSNGFRRFVRDKLAGRTLPLPVAQVIKRIDIIQQVFLIDIWP